MTDKELFELNIIEPDKDIFDNTKHNWDMLAKPIDGLGDFETLVCNIAAIQKKVIPDISKKALIIMCADNGVVCENVTQTDQSVTFDVASLMAKRASSVGVMTLNYALDIIPVDIGINSETKIESVIDKKIRRATGNILKEAAMSRDECLEAIRVGIDLVKECSKKGYGMIATGEMGIGNTTTSSALASVLLGEPASEVTGKGAGLDSEGIKRKISVIHRAIEVNAPDKNNPVELLSKLGGYDIAGMTGLFLGGAVYKIPVIIDGFISAVAAALAVDICPLAKNYILCSHVSKEPAGVKILEYLGLKPLITAEMCLGEGTGGAMLLPLLDGAIAVYNSSHQFDNLPIERYVEL